MKSQPSIKVSSGRLKGRKIFIPQTETTRPTKAIVRESLFDTLQSELIDCGFAELFAGSGSVGIEAYSRGVEYVCFVEQSKLAFDTLQANIKSLGVQNTHTIQGSAFDKIGEVCRYFSHINTPAWFYIDPPFDIRSNQSEIYTKVTNLMQQLDPNHTKGAIVEHRSDIDLSSTIGFLDLFKRRKFGKTTLSYYLNRSN